MTIPAGKHKDALPIEEARRRARISGKSYYERKGKFIAAEKRALRKQDKKAQLQWHFYQRNRMLVQRYGITLEEYAKRLEQQGGRCAICTRDRPGNGHDRYFDVDHCHDSGKVRGLLCRQCNVMLGHLEKLNRPGMLDAVRKYLGFTVEWDPK